MNILILGAAGQIGRIVTDRLLEETNHNLVLFARNAHSRLSVNQSDRVKLVDGDFTDEVSLLSALTDIDIVYLNDMNSPEATEMIVQAMQSKNVKRLICASVLAIYDEVPGAFGRWNERMVGAAGINRHKESASIVENSGLDYTLLRLTWLYNQANNEDYMVTQKGEPFVGAQVTREAVARLVMNIFEEPSLHSQESIGVSEPDTDWGKPSFY